MEQNRPLFRAARAAAAAGVTVTRLRKLADCGCPVSAGTAAGEHRRWSNRDVFIAAVGSALMSSGMSAVTAANLLRPHWAWLLSTGEPTYFDIQTDDGSLVCRVQLAEIASAVGERLAVLDAAARLTSTPARRVDAPQLDRSIR